MLNGWGESCKREQRGGGEEAEEVEEEGEGEGELPASKTRGGDFPPRPVLDVSSNSVTFNTQGL